MTDTHDGRPAVEPAPSEEALLGSHADNGAPAPSDRNSLTVGADGPILLHDTHFLNQMVHFNRERIPERNDADDAAPAKDPVVEDATNAAH